MSNSLESRSDSLTPGQPVFLLGYHDREMRLPFLEAYVFLGVRTQDEVQSERWCFQQAEAYLRSPIESIEAAQSREGVLYADKEGLGTMVDWIGLVAELAERLEDQRRC